MSRGHDYDDYWDTDVDHILSAGRWEHNTRATLRSKRGQQALRELREALLALPEKRLIANNLCTVRYPEEAAKMRADEHYETPTVSSYFGGDPEMLEAEVAEQGFGVCAVGALLWHRQVKAGMDPTAAFHALPLIVNGDDMGSDGLDDTADLAAHQAGIARTLAWNLASRNDDSYSHCTPEQRYAKFMDWLDRNIVEPVVAAAD